MKGTLLGLAFLGVTGVLIAGSAVVRIWRLERDLRHHDVPTRRQPGVFL